jgi:hypothetical protein
MARPSVVAAKNWCRCYSTCLTTRDRPGRAGQCVDLMGKSLSLVMTVRGFQFSTNTSGTGLGLAIVRRLVEGWGGKVHARRGTERGAEIVIEFASPGTGESA